MNAAVDREIFPRALGTGGVRSAAVSGSFAILLSQIVKLGLQFGTQLVLARILFPADFGLLAMIAPVIGVVMIINDIGFGQVVIQRPSIYQNQVSNLFWVNLAVGAALGACVVAAAPLAAYLYKEPRALALTAAMAVTIPIGTLGILPNALLTRRMRFATLAKIDIAALLCGSAVTIGGSLAGLGYWALALGQIVATTLVVAGGWLQCGWRPSAPTRSLSVREEFAFGRNVTGTNLSTFASKSVDSLLIGANEGPVQLGLYDRSYRLLVQPLGQILLPLNRVAVPLLSSLLSDPADFRRTYLFMVQLLVVVTVPGLVVCVADGTTVVRFLMGARWEPAAPIFGWMCTGGLASGLFSSAAWLFIAQDRTGKMLKYWVAAALINVASYGIGIFWGAVGVAAVSGVTFVLLQTPLVLHGALKNGPVRALDIARVIAPAAIAGGLAFVIVRFVPVLRFGSDPLTLAVHFGIGYGLMFALLASTRAGREFMSRGARMVGKLVRRTGR